MNLHPDLEALSASLDGEDEGARAHAVSCAECGAQMAQLRAVRDAVAGPVAPLPGAVREASILAALDGFGARSGAGAAAGSGTGSGAGAAPVAPVAEVVSLASRRWQWVAGGAVAAVLVLIVGMATLFGGGVSRDAQTTAAQAPFAENEKPSTTAA